MSKYPQLIEAMLQPDFYPHPVKTPIQLLQTHISFIFLTGVYAYKLKKTVDLNFLDFSTLAKRHYYLQEELRLNQQVAPKLYLEVLPISKVEGKYQLNATEVAAEYVLKMRQFPQEQLLINLLLNGQLTLEQISELAKIIAKFHQQAPTNPHISSYGSAANIAQAIADNYENTRKYIGTIQPISQYRETQAFTDQFIVKYEHLLGQRQNQGKIIEGHGDLHLGNICIYQGQIQLFDRLEFNESFRCVDVMYDLAFTLMDLDRYQRQDLSNRLLNKYTEITGDWQGLQVLPLYLCRQAYVRAKVNSFLTEATELDTEKQEQRKQDAQAYYNLAWKYAQPRKGRIILMSGLSGSGKSTIARQLAPQLQAVQIRSDAARKHLAGIPIQQPGPSSIYSRDMDQQTYDYLLKLGIELAQQGYTVILDAKYDLHQWRQAAIAQATAINLPLQIVYCTAPLSVLQERLQHRQQDVSDATPNLLAAQSAKFEAFTAAEKAYIVTIDTSKNENNLSILSQKG